jgi:hypothetical protein
MDPSLHRRGERGASLVLVLALIGFLAVVLPAVLGLVTTGSRVSVPVAEDRRALYAANSALDAVVAQARRDDAIGRPGTACPEQVLSIEGFEVTVGCAPVTRFCDLDRYVYYAATVREPGQPTVLARAGAEVAYRFNPDLTQRTEVRRWNPGLTGTTTTSTLPPCPVPTSPTASTTTTVPPTTSTTTTTAPSPDATTTTTTTPDSVLAEWALNELPTELRGSGSSEEWRAFGEVRALTGARAPIADGTVTVQAWVRERTGNNLAWIPAPQIIGTSNEVGSVTFHGPWSSMKNNAVDAMRLRIVSVSANGTTTDLPVANSFRCGFRSDAVDRSCPPPA